MAVWRSTSRNHHHHQERNSYSTHRSSSQPFYPSVFSGIQPTGVPHLGNYLGALRQWVDIQTHALSNPHHDPTSLIFSIVDLHALTGNQSSQILAQNRKESFISLLAIGLSPAHSTLFLQSDIPAHASLHWILSTVASTGYLSRMTQWKSKLSLPETANISDATALDKLRLGLFSYPVLQAADILLYRPDVVPVGEDQAQHIEFARTLARSFNAAYCGSDGGHDGQQQQQQQQPPPPLFVPPTVQISAAKRIMSLRRPLAKMSKSDADPKSRVLITDSPEAIHAKIRGAVTDSEDGITYEPARRPGVANLLDIYRFVRRDARPPEEVAREVAALSKAEFKQLVGQAVVAELAPVRRRYAELMSEGNNEAREAYEVGLARARAKADETMALVRQAVGLVDWR